MPRPYRYQLTHRFADRQKESLSVRQRYPNAVPVVCEPAPDIPLSDRRQMLRELDCSKFLIPDDATMQQVILLLRGRLLLESEQGLFVFVGDAMPPSHTLLADLYVQKKDPDGFLYMTYSIESAFGGGNGK